MATPGTSAHDPATTSTGPARPGSDVRIVALDTPVRFTEGDDIGLAVLDALAAADQTLVDGDVVCVSSKVVALAEGRVVALPDGPERLARRELARREATAIVADTPGVLITRTPHGFVVANGGIDQSNVQDGHALLLPEDPDTSAATIRTTLERATGATVGVIVTDTFGRPWRNGQTDVALGVAGTAAIRDERGGRDLDDRLLEVTSSAVADAVAAATELVRTKASATPFVLVRGLAPGAPGTGRDLVRDLDEDLFATGGPTAAEQAVHARRTVREFDLDRPVDDSVLRAAVAAAATAPAPHHTRPWRFIRLRGRVRHELLDAMAEQWRADLTGDGVDPAIIGRRVKHSDALMREVPELIAAFVVTDGSHAYPDDRRTGAERDLFVLSGGAALQNAQIVLASHGLGAAWLSSTAFCADTVRATLGLGATWHPIGMMIVGWPREPVPARPRRDADDLLIEP